MPEATPYQPRRAPRSRHIDVRGLRYHLNEWGDSSLASADRPPLLMLHGWRDVGASFQFVVDALAAVEGFERWVIAPDWRGFGLTDPLPGTDTYWIPDYLGDLDGVLDRLDLPRVDMLGHSMGGNVVMLYAGLRAERVRRLVNLEGFGMPQTPPAQAPKRLLKWLDALKQPQTLRSYDSVDAVAARLLQNNPLLTPDKAAWLAPHWSRQRADGQWLILGDPAHKRINPVLAQREEALATWRQITAPVLWVEGDQTDMSKWWGDRYPRSDFEARLAVVTDLQRAVLKPCGHMLHHDQPDALASRLATFLA